MLQFPPIRGKFAKFTHISAKSIFRYPRISSSILIITSFVLASIITGKSFDRPVRAVESKTTIASRIEFSHTREITPTITPRIIRRTGVYGELTVKKIVPTSTPTPTEISKSAAAANSSSGSGSSGLLNSINGFRTANGVAQVLSSSTLCDIAGKRLSENISLGHLDSHAGFGKFFQGQNEFNSMGEVLFWASLKEPPDYAVNEGWAKSTSGHRENMLDPKWNYGCGATDEYYAVFEFGKK